MFHMSCYDLLIFFWLNRSNFLNCCHGITDWVLWYDALGGKRAVSFQYLQIFHDETLAENTRRR